MLLFFEFANLPDFDSRRTSMERNAGDQTTRVAGGRVATLRTRYKINKVMRYMIIVNLASDE
jgi:hypothetical protein